MSSKNSINITVWDINTFLSAIVEVDLASKIDTKKTAEKVYNLLNGSWQASFNLATQIWHQIMLNLNYSWGKITVSWKLVGRKWSNEKTFSNRWDKLKKPWKVPNQFKIN